MCVCVGICEQLVCVCMCMYIYNMHVSLSICVHVFQTVWVCAGLLVSACECVCVYVYKQLSVKKHLCAKVCV